MRDIVGDIAEAGKINGEIAAQYKRSIIYLDFSIRQVGGKGSGRPLSIFSSGDSAALSCIVSALMLSHQDGAANGLDATQNQLAELYA
ncbi:hypothetical protein FHT82_004988 [Rhizobium sp. BK275]|uniref:hypothetical protein n=1 Tax=Rhizobium sp. BK275 TaxID=2587077 RepID=UPI00161BC32C|nr:hypothetical protein [Rhizobium sp. BK275]MBB3392207.1 hypothetical protein [Rhizobium sp. BK275]